MVPRLFSTAFSGEHRSFCGAPPAGGFYHDKLGQLVKVTDTDPFQLYNKTPKVKYEYKYDANGNVIYEFQRDSDAEENLKSHTDYTYDALDRLTGSTQKTERYPNDSAIRTYTCDSLVKEEEICSPTTQGPKNITIGTYLYDETDRMVQGTNKDGEASLYTLWMAASAGSCRRSPTPLMSMTMCWICSMPRPACMTQTTDGLRRWILFLNQVDLYTVTIGIG